MPSSHDTLVTCKRCSNKVAVRDMKYDLNGKDLICGRCYELKVSSLKKPKTAGQYTDPPKAKFEFSNPLEGKEEVKYYCPKCKFKFSRKKEHGIPRLCPYCSKSAVVEAYRGSANELLKDSSSNEFDY